MVPQILRAVFLETQEKIINSYLTSLVYSVKIFP